MFEFGRFMTDLVNFLVQGFLFGGIVFSGIMIGVFLTIRFAREREGAEKIIFGEKGENFLKHIFDLTAKLLMAPALIFKNPRVAALFWGYSCILIAAVSTFVVFNLLSKERNGVVVLDGAGAYHVAPVVEMQKAKEMVLNCATMAANAALEMESGEPKYGKLFDQLYTKDAADSLKSQLGGLSYSDGRKVESRKFEVMKIENKEVPSPGSVFAYVEGELKTKGVLSDGSPFEEKKNVSCSFMLLWNKNVRSDGMLPLVVRKCKVMFEKV